MEKLKLEKMLQEWNAFFVVEKKKIMNIHETLLTEYQTVSLSYEEISNKQKEIAKEIEYIQQMVTVTKKDLAKVRDQFEAVDNEEIQKLFEQTHHFQTELIILKQKESSVEEEVTALLRKGQELEKNKERAEHLRKKISIVSEYLLNDFLSDTVTSPIHNQQTIGLKILEAQENEKGRISREIHDGPAQMLANMLMQYEFIDQAFINGQVELALEEVKSFRLNIESTLAELRRIIFDLRPMILDDLGLVPTLNRQVVEMEKQAKIPIQLTITGFEERLLANQEVAVFRLVQEAIQNAISHAKASYIRVSLEMLPHHINVIVEDDGIGFNVNGSTIGSNSFGLIGMKERIELMQGEIAINSKKGSGTSVKMKIPIKC